MTRMDAQKLFPRPMRQALADALEDTPVVCILGPRQCGKSTLAQISAPKRACITLDEAAIHRVAYDDPDGSVAGLPDPVTLDGVQRAPHLIQAIKKAVDTDRTPGRFLSTGSANLLLLPQVTESLAGRTEIVHLRRLKSQAGKHCQGGVILYGGSSSRQPNTGIAVAPIAYLWEL
jgi:uncharacterized protein